MSLLRYKKLLQLPRSAAIDMLLSSNKRERFNTKELKNAPKARKFLAKVYIEHQPFF
jgi:hypothetical protein